MALATIKIDDLSLTSYQTFLNVKRMPYYEVRGREIVTDEENLKYLDGYEPYKTEKHELNVSEHLFDYQRFIISAAIRKKRFAIFADCGLGKTAMFLEWTRVVRQFIGNKKVLIVCPLMVIEQIIDEQAKFYGSSDLVNVHNVGIEKWLASDSAIGVVNIDKFKEPIDLRAEVGAVILDESSCLKSETSAIRTNLINSTKGIEYKLACTATPAPNDRQEYANHALFLEKIRSHGEFFAKYFVNKDNQWVLKKHATEAFYRYLASFSVFLRRPDRYGFDDNLAGLKEPLFTEIDVELTPDQVDAVRQLQTDKQRDEGSFVPSTMVQRTKFAQIAKGFVLDDAKQASYMPTLKTQVIVDIIANHPGEQVLIWAQFDEEAKILEEAIESAGYRVCGLHGKTPKKRREQFMRDFRDGKYDVMITKPKLLGFGLNMQYVSVMIFSGINDSYEQFYQAIKRAHRYGSKHQLKVYLPITPLERPMLENVLAKKDMFETDATIQENLYVESLKDDLEAFIDKPIESYVTNNDLREYVEPAEIQAWFS